MQESISKRKSVTTNLLALLSIILWLSGCATSASSPPAAPKYCTVDYQAQLLEIQRVGLTTTSDLPTIESVMLGHTRGEGAAVGAGFGAAGGASVAADIATSTGSDPYALLVALILLPILVAGGAVGGAVVGTATGHAPETLAEAEAHAQAILSSVHLQAEILQRAEDYVLTNVDLEFIRLPNTSPESRVANQAYTDLPDQSIDAVLEVDLHRISLKHSLEMEARSRLISSRMGDVLSENIHVFQSESRSLHEWTENGAAQLREAIDRGLTVLAEDIIDEDFSLFPRKGSEGKFASNDPEFVINQDIMIRRITSTRDSVRLGSKFSPDLLNIPEGKSAIFIYRPGSYFATDWAVPVMINDMYLSKLPKDGFDCLIVDP
mgnify:FL=1